MALHAVNMGSVSSQRDLFDVHALPTQRDFVRAESSLLEIEPHPHGLGRSFASGLVTRDDGVKMQPASVPPPVALQYPAGEGP